MRRDRLTVALFAVATSAFVLAMLGRAWAVDAPRLSAIPPTLIPPSTVNPSPTMDPPASALSMTPPMTSSPPAGFADRAASPTSVRPGPPAATAVANAHAVGASRVERLAVAVLDLRTGRLYSAGDIDAPFPSASLVKVFIAARLLTEGRADDPGVADRMWRMIACSDDDAASWLYGLVGGDEVTPWVGRHYGITGLAPPSMPGWWGMTDVTARGMVEFYARAAEDPAVGPWLRAAMGSTEPYGCDGFYQHYGLPAVAQAWQVKQGWMCCQANLSRMHSTGYVNDRYAVAVLAEGPTWIYGGHGAQTLTLVAQALLPDGVVPAK